MAYNRRNYLLRVLQIQEITLEHQKSGSPYTWIHKNIIHPEFKISYNTFISYMGVNAKAELKKIDNDKPI